MFFDCKTVRFWLYTLLYEALQCLANLIAYGEGEATVVKDRNSPNLRKE